MINMDMGDLTYRPDRYNTVVTWMMVICSVVWYTFGVVDLLCNGINIGIIPHVIFLILVVFTAKRTHQLACISFVLRKSELVIVSSEGRKCQFYPWEYFHHAQMYKDYKGNKFVFLSSEVIDLNEAKFFDWKLFLTGETHLDNTIIIPVPDKQPHLKDISKEIIQRIESHITILPPAPSKLDGGGKV